MRTGKTRNGTRQSSLAGVAPKKKEITWILVAHRAGARLFAQEGKQGPVTIAKVFPFPEGRLKESANEGDRPGRSFDSHTSSRHGQTGGPRHSLGGEHLPSVQYAERFSAQLAGELKSERMRGAYDALVLIAEPRLLGQLRGALDPATQETITRTVEKDFAWLAGHELTARLRELLQGLPT